MESGIASELVFDCREMLRHSRAELDERTAGVDERQQDGFTAPIAQPKSLSILVDELGVGRELADPDPFGRARLFRRRKGATDDELLEPVLPKSASVPDHEDRVEPVSRGERAEHLVVLHRKGHGHPGHQAFDILVIDGDGSARGVDADDFPAQLEAPLLDVLAGDEKERQYSDRTASHSDIDSQSHTPAAACQFRRKQGCQRCRLPPPSIWYPAGPGARKPRTMNE